ncbi:LLM class flavin-dependent oxidoreductase [Aldersonia kunmingensis]|uniref:LLM class flavin-dependent oxidoreductase n=1 Tax=Aldersonia kunmingensis TaxID=408066 RepID=UPI00082A5C78|nr:LLM class flavin-dependent oxidoreductase [Aldersonia kunmingensis]
MSDSRPIGVGITPLTTSRDLAVDLALRAEELGYTSVYVAEGWGNDASVILAEIALKTNRIRIGTGIINIWGRTPATVAMMATTLSDLSNGRFELGIGAGSPTLAEGLHGYEFRATAARLREFTRQVRGLLDGERAAQVVPGVRTLRLSVRPQAPVHISVAALGPRAVRTCGELADGWYPFLLSPSGLAPGMRLLEAGAEAADRPRPAVCPGIPTAVHEDPEQARAIAAWWISFYLTKMGPLYGQTLRGLGFGDLVDEVVAANRESDTAQVPESAQALIDELTITGDPETAAMRLDRWYAAGADMPVVVLPPNASREDLDRTLVALRPQ